MEWVHRFRKEGAAADLDELLGIEVDDDLDHLEPEEAELQHGGFGGRFRAWFEFGPVSAMKSGLFGPGNRTKSPVFQWNFGVKQKTNQQSRREIELFEEVSEEVSG